MMQKRILRSVVSVDFSFALIVANQHMVVDHARCHQRKLKKRPKYIKKETIQDIIYFNVALFMQQGTIIRPMIVS